MGVYLSKKSANIFFNENGLLKAILFASSVLMLGGCSALNIGADEFGCKGLPEGVSCMSTSDVYEMTNNGQVPRSMDADTKDGSAIGTKNSNSHLRSRSAENDVRDNYVTNRLPDESIPIRAPAQVMRIWISPFENTTGDYVSSGLVYTEIEPRRWIPASKAKVSSANFQPLKKK